MTQHTQHTPDPQHYRCSWCSNPGVYDAVGADFVAVERPSYLCALHWCLVMECTPDELGLDTELPKCVYGPQVVADTGWSADDLRVIALVPPTTSHEDLSFLHMNTQVCQ